MDKLTLINDFDNTIKNCKCWEEALKMVMKLTKKEMLQVQDDIAEYEGHNWTKEEGAKHLICNYRLPSLRKKIYELKEEIKRLNGIPDEEWTECQNDLLIDAVNEKGLLVIELEKIEIGE